MANPEHLAKLREGVEEWNRWRKVNNNVKPDLSGEVWDRTDLVGLYLIGAQLDFANLSNTNFNGSNLSRASLFGANLTNAYLGAAHLRNTNLGVANLSEANLSEADLNSANLSSANLTRSILVDTDLTDVNLTHANLTSAKLLDAKLTQANLTQAELIETDFSGANIGLTVFGHVDLSTCIGLATVEVKSPCIIDFHSLRVSKNINKSFLVKIGLPELLVEHLPDFLIDKDNKLYPVFISHSWKNKDFARKLYEALITKGVNVFFDEKKMKPGDTIFDSISRGIGLYDKTILVCSKDSLESWWVDQELELITEKERNLQKETSEKTGLLIPITIDDYIYNWQGGKRMAIRNRIIGDFQNWKDDAAFEKALNDLIYVLYVNRPDIKPPSYLKKK